MASNASGEARVTRRTPTLTNPHPHPNPDPNPHPHAHAHPRPHPKQERPKVETLPRLQWLRKELSGKLGRHTNLAQPLAQARQAP